MTGGTESPHPPPTSIARDEVMQTPRDARMQLPFGLEMSDWRELATSNPTSLHAAAAASRYSGAH